MKYNNLIICSQYQTTLNLPDPLKDIRCVSVLCVSVTVTNHELFAVLYFS